MVGGKQRGSQSTTVFSFTRGTSAATPTRDVHTHSVIGLLALARVFSTMD
ncbi:MAG: hypothetical protein ABI234_11500 [Ktedonobacteraceae bacterium]